MRVIHRIVALIAVPIITACATTKSHQYVSSRVDSDTIRLDRAAARTSRVSDSVRIADSVIVLIQGDTVHLREVHWRTRYVSTRDTLRDTVRVYSSRTAAQIESSVTQSTRWRIKGVALLLSTSFMLALIFLVWTLRKKL